MIFPADGYGRQPVCIGIAGGTDNAMAMMARRKPSIDTNPQPVALSPGSIPSIRIYYASIFAIISSETEIKGQALHIIIIFQRIDKF